MGIVIVLSSLICILVTLGVGYLYRRGSNQNQDSKSDVSSSELPGYMDGQLSAIKVVSTETDMSVLSDGELYNRARFLSWMRGSSAGSELPSAAGTALVGHTCATQSVARDTDGGAGKYV